MSHLIESLDDLPDEILLHIFGHLPNHTSVNLGPAQDQYEKGMRSLFNDRAQAYQRWKRGSLVLTGSKRVHTGYVFQVIHDAKRDQVLSCGADGALIIWDVDGQDGLTYKQTLLGHSGSIFRFCVDNDSHSLVTGGSDPILNVWNRDTGSVEHSIAMENSTWGLHADSNLIIAGGASAKVDLYRRSDYERIAQWSEHNSNIFALGVQNGTLATASEDKTTILWDLGSGKVKSRLAGHAKAVRCLQFTDNTILTGSWDNSLKLWDARTEDCVGTFEGSSKGNTKGHSNNVLCCRFDAFKMVSGSVDQTARLWDFRTMQEYACVKDFHGSVAGIDFDSERLYTGTGDNHVHSHVPRAPIATPGESSSV